MAVPRNWLVRWETFFSKVLVPRQIGTCKTGIYKRRSFQYQANHGILTITRRSMTMATTVQPASGESTKQLINYRVDAGVAVIELSDPPANTYTYEMNRQLDEAILKARMDK